MKTKKLNTEPETVQSPAESPTELGAAAGSALLRREHLNDLSKLAMGVWNELLAEWTNRPRKLGKYVASHPKTLARLVKDLDARGEVEAADAIHSLVWELAMQRSRDMRDIIGSVELGIMFRDEQNADVEARRQ